MGLLIGFVFVAVVLGISGFVCGLAVKGVWYVLARRALSLHASFAAGVMLALAYFSVAYWHVGGFRTRYDVLQERVTLKGRVVDASGVGAEGVQVRIEPGFTGSDSGDLYNWYPARETVTDAGGSYALADVKPLSERMTAFYLVNSNATLRSDHFFFGLIRAERPRHSGYTPPQLEIPVVSENSLKRARRMLRGYHMLGWPPRERKDLCLPRSQGDVIFLPEIVLADEPEPPAPAPEMEKAGEADVSGPVPVSVRNFKPGEELPVVPAGRAAAFKQACEADKRTFGETLFREIEKLYQSANKDLAAPEAKEALKRVVDNYPKSNRAGCAVQYLGQMSEGEERERYFLLAIKEHGACCYGSGVQVGAYARYYLGHHYLRSGREKEAKTLFAEIRKEFPDAVNHQGRRLADSLAP